MGFKDTERRKCKRFVITGATVSYKRLHFFSKGKYTEELYPVLDLSLGGVRFLSMKSLAINDKLSLKIFIPDKDITLVLKGHVRWLAINPEQSYRYKIGIQFDPFSENKDHNDLESLNILKGLEQQFSKDDDDYTY